MFYYFLQVWNKLFSFCKGRILVQKTNSTFLRVVKHISFPFTVRPSVSLDPGPHYFVEGSNAILPVCHVTGHPTPVVTWSRSFGQLPQGRVQSNNSVIKVVGVRKVDSDNYLCTATNLLGSVVKRTQLHVVSLPQFIVKPPAKSTVGIGEILTLNCSATGDQQPVMNWRRKDAQLPTGRTQQANGVLVIRNTRKEDAGNYICAATSAGFFNVETVSFIEVLSSRGKYLYYCNLCPIHTNLIRLIKPG